MSFHVTDRAPFWPLALHATATRAQVQYIRGPRALAIPLALVLLLGTPIVEARRQLEEVVVTAQKREESLQDVPISMTVVGAEELAQLSIFDFTETANLTPGVDFFPSVQAAAIRLRGVGPGSFALTSPQSVAMFIDDIAQGSVGAAFSTLVDVERIELLRGPQGTLYGQNAPGGAYNIPPKRPTRTSSRVTWKGVTHNSRRLQIWRGLMRAARSISP